MNGSSLSPSIDAKALFPICYERVPTGGEFIMRLIEIIIIIGVIGVLAAIATPNFQKCRQRSDVRAAQATKKTIAGALEMYNLDNNTLVMPKGGIGNIDRGTLIALQQQGYLQSVPHEIELERIKNLPMSDFENEIAGQKNRISQGKLGPVATVIGNAATKVKVLLTTQRKYGITPQANELLSGKDLLRADLTRDEFLEKYGVNPFYLTKDDNLSTFSMDVDTASYTRMKALVESGQVPETHEVRIEEYINYFNYEYKASKEKTFAVHTQGVPSIFHDGYTLFKVGLKAKDADEANRTSLALTLVVDCSGSMSPANRLPLVRESLKDLVSRLHSSDKVALVAYGSSAHVVLEHTSVKKRNRIVSAIDSLCINGSTNADAGITLGYEVASSGFDKSMSNRVIICSDGVANMGRVKSKEILSQVKELADGGIYMTTIGYGMNQYNDKLMEELADNGNGSYSYIGDMKEAGRFFEKEIGGGYDIVALDSKIQVKFDPANVESYRLLGYENRKVADSDFRNDNVDAGEVGCGHMVTAVYELKLTDSAKGREDGALGMVNVRYLNPHTKEAVEEHTLIPSNVIKDSLGESSYDSRLAFVVAGYSEILKDSYFAKGLSVNELIPYAEDLIQEDPDDDVIELIKLMKKVNSRNMLASAR